MVYYLSSGMLNSAPDYTALGDSGSRVWEANVDRYACVTMDQSGVVLLQRRTWFVGYWRQIRMNG